MNFCPACSVGKPALVRSALRSGPGNDRIGIKCFNLFNWGIKLNCATFFTHEWKMICLKWNLVSHFLKEGGQKSTSTCILTYCTHK